MQMYLHPPLECVDWFHIELGWPYDPDEDGAVADWVISVVSTGFQSAQNAKCASVQQHLHSHVLASQAGLALRP